MRYLVKHEPTSSTVYLSDANGLLLHDLVYGGAVVVRHLVELVDAAHAAVRQHQRAALQHHLPGERVLRGGRDTSG